VDGGANQSSVAHQALHAVFDNKTLAAIAEARPATLAALGAIKVGACADIARPVIGCRL